MLIYRDIDFADPHPTWGSVRFNIRSKVSCEKGFDMSLVRAHCEKEEKSRRKEILFSTLIL